MRSTSFFQTLRGKLILTYTTVTVLALLALEITVLLIGVAYSNGSRSDALAYLDDVVVVLAPQARDYLQPGRPDQAGLQAWLQRTYEGGYASLPPQFMLDNPAAPIVKAEPMLVIAPDRTVLAAVPASAQTLVGKPYSLPATLPGSSKALESALALDLQTGRLSVSQPDGNYWMAVPIQQEARQGPLVGVILLTVQAPPVGYNRSWPILIWILPVTALLLLLAVAPFGALFGFVMSNGLTRRLTELTRAVDAWSDGDFSVQPQDRADDEISYLGIRLRRMAEHIQTLMQTQHELALMEERNRLARELHDTVKQEAFATLMQVRAAKNLLETQPAAARDALEKAEALIKSSQQELGLMIYELRPTALDGRGLAAALGDYLPTWSQHARIPANLQVQNEQRLPLETEQALYRVAQEALSNVARHSRASAAAVWLAFEAGQVTLRIADNGVGFDPAAVGGGFGLQSMRDRVRAIEGQLSIEAGPQGGVILTAIAPAYRPLEAAG